MLNILSCEIAKGIDPIVPGLTSLVVTAIKLFVPLALIFFGMLDLGKAVIANDEKVMKEAQGKLIKRFIYAVVVFLIVALVQLVFNLLADASSGNGDSDSTIQKNDINSCISCFISGPNSAGCKNN